MSDLIPFDFNGAEVRVAMQGGEPWFVAADVCRVLEIADVRQATDRLDDDERGGCDVPTPGGMQRVRAVSESGLYSLVLGSRKPEARAFKRWITKEVIPSIRKTGSYGVAPASDLDSMDGLTVLASQLTTRLIATTQRAIAAESKVVEQAEVIAITEAKLEEAGPALALAARFARRDGNFTLQNASRSHGLRPRLLGELAKAKGDIFYEGGSLVAKADLMCSKGGRGYFDLVPAENHTTVRDDGTRWAGLQFVITPKGWLWAPKRYGFLATDAMKVGA